MSNFKIKESVDLKRDSDSLLEGKNALPKSGDIILFASNTPPAGWAICDGTNGTPDLRSYIPVGARSSANVGSVLSNGSHSHGYAMTASNVSTFSGVASVNHGGIDSGVDYSGGGWHDHGAGTGYVGSAAAGSNLLANSGNAGGPISFVNRPHSHGGSGGAYYGATNIGNHIHYAPGITQNGSTHAHNTNHSFTSYPSGNTSASDIKAVTISLNYIMKL